MNVLQMNRTQIRQEAARIAKKTEALGLVETTAWAKQIVASCDSEELGKARASLKVLIQLVE